MLRNPSDRHKLIPQDVMQVVCSVCDTEQHVEQVCANCGVRMGEYFCSICKFYDDDTAKDQFHCDDRGIFRVGGRENFFHCKKYGSCYSIGLQHNHSCVENSMRPHCPICYDYLFDSLKATTVMKCGHTMHCECFTEMLKHDKYCCPICSRSVIDMSRTWKRLDEEIEATIMPEDYRYKKVWILCNDTTEVYFHIIGQKCCHCNSYNTRAISPPVLPRRLFHSKARASNSFNPKDKWLVIRDHLQSFIVFLIRLVKVYLLLNKSTHRFDIRGYHVSLPRTID